MKVSAEREEKLLSEQRLMRDELETLREEKRQAQVELQGLKRDVHKTGAMLNF